MNKYVLAALAVFFVFLVGCTAQNLQPKAAPIYNVTITQTDNSQYIAGDNNKAEAKPTTKAQATADIKPEIKANAEATTKNGMWIFWLVVLAVVAVALWLAWIKWGKLYFTAR